MATQNSKVQSRDVYLEKSSGSKLWKKTKEAPYVPIGILGMAGMVGYGVYNFKNKGKMSTSVYLMHLRVKAQAMVVGAMAIGMGFSLLRDALKDEKSK